MNKYLINTKIPTPNKNQVLCVNDYGVEGEIIPKKWYNKISENNTTYYLQNEWGEVETYSKDRFRVLKDNLPLN